MTGETLGERRRIKIKNRVGEGLGFRGGIGLGWCVGLGGGVDKGTKVGVGWGEVNEIVFQFKKV